jgi:hypothetical protein
MDWTVEYLKDDNIIRTVVTGRVTLEGINRLLVERFELSKQTGTRLFLSDYRHVSLGVSVNDVHQMPKSVYESGLVGQRDKIAVVYLENSPHNHHFTFFDTMCSLSPLNCKTFVDPDVARSWLLDHTV